MRVIGLQRTGFAVQPGQGDALLCGKVGVAHRRRHEARHFSGAELDLVDESGAAIDPHQVLIGFGVRRRRTPGGQDRVVLLAAMLSAAAVQLQRSVE